MRKFQWQALALCALLVLTGLLGACRGPAVVAKVGKTNITNADVNVFANFILFSNGYTWQDITTAEDMQSLMNSALDGAVTNELLMQKGTQMGLAPLNAQDQKDIDDQAGTYADQIADYAKQPGAALTKDDVVKLMTQFKVGSLIEEQTDKDIAVTDAEVQSKYDELTQQQKQSFDADASAYEQAIAAGDTIVYVPAGFRYVKHILIAFEDVDSSAISTARSSGDNTDADKLRDTALGKIKPKADEVMAKVTSGEDFDKLIADYGQDPGMQNEPEKTTGYEIGSTSSFVQEFKDAAMKLGKVGDVSPLVATDYGYHIIKYVGDVTSGPVALDTVKDTLKETVLNDKKNENWDKTIEQWKTEANVATYPERLNTAVPTAAPETPAPAAS